MYIATVAKLLYYLDSRLGSRYYTTVSNSEIELGLLFRNIPWNSQENTQSFLSYFLYWVSKLVFFKKNESWFCEIDFSREKAGICFTSAFLIGWEILKVVMMTKVIHPKFYKHLKEGAHYSN